MPAVDTIVTEAEEYGFTRFSSARKISLLNKAYDKIMTAHLWPFLEKVATSVSVSSGSWSVPADMRSIISVTNRTANFALTEETPEAFALRTAEHGSETASVTSGQSALYYRVEGGLPGGAVTNWPSDSAAVHVQYYQDHAVLASGGAEGTILIPIRHHDVLSYGLIRELYLISKQYDDAQVFDGLFRQGIRDMEADVFSTSIDDSDLERQFQINRGISPAVTEEG